MTDHSRVPDTRRILRARAAALARPLPQVDTITDRIQVIEFTLGSESYAVELAYVAEVRGLANLTPLPGTPPLIAGIVAVRGHIISVVDLKVLLGLPRAAQTGAEKALILRHNAMEFGLLVDGVTGVQALPSEQIHPPLPTTHGSGARYVRGITASSLTILDGGKMLADESFVVNEEANV